MFELLVSAVPYAVVDDIFAGLFRDATRQDVAGIGGPLFHRTWSLTRTI